MHAVIEPLHAFTACDGPALVVGRGAAAFNDPVDVPLALATTLGEREAEGEAIRVVVLRLVRRDDTAWARTALEWLAERGRRVLLRTSVVMSRDLEEAARRWGCTILLELAHRRPALQAALLSDLGGSSGVVAAARSAPAARGARGRHAPHADPAGDPRGPGRHGRAAATRGGGGHPRCSFDGRPADPPALRSPARGPAARPVALAAARVRSERCGRGSHGRDRSCGAAAAVAADGCAVSTRFGWKRRPWGCGSTTAAARRSAIWIPSWCRTTSRSSRRICSRTRADRRRPGQTGSRLGRAVGLVGLVEIVDGLDAGHACDSDAGGR